ESRVETVGVIKEAATPRVGFAFRFWVRVIKRVDIPPALCWETRDRVPALDEQLPKIFGCSHATGVAAAHCNDRDRVVLRRVPRGGRFRRGGRSNLATAELGTQPACNGERGRMVKEQRRGQAQARDGAESIA